ncbi:hypothetical protein GCM10027160_34650 [Streptomyces calidiresistens]
MSPLHHHLLRELDLGDLPAPDTSPESYTARGLDPDAVRDVLPFLKWTGLVERPDGDGGTVRLTPLGAATRLDAECDGLAERLGAVVSFADTISRGAAPRLAAHALRCLADGTWTLEQAEAHVRTGGPGGDAS